MSLFVTFEGTTGSGKTTQLHLLAEYLMERGYDVLTTREPGGTVIGDSIRDLLLTPQHSKMLPLTEVLLFSASRAQLVSQVIRPHLEKGGVVLCDRYADSTLAYQGYGHGLDLAFLRRITTQATGGLVPDLTLFLDLPVERGLKRRLPGPHGQLPLWGEVDRLDMQVQDFHRRVRQGYLELAAAEPQRWKVINAHREVDEIQGEIRDYVETRLAGNADT
ncbi:MAG: dTMP kinase [Chloroflexota bacterium]|nr:dTMP kinase [Chloroflexota bacterium]